MKKQSRQDIPRFRVSDLIKGRLLRNDNIDWNLPAARSREFVWSGSATTPDKFRISLYRFLRDNLPLLSSCIWTWSRLCSAPGQFEITGAESDKQEQTARDILEELSCRIYPFRFQKLAGMESFLPVVFSSLFTDGAFAGFLAVLNDGSGIDRFVPIDPTYIGLTEKSYKDRYLTLETDSGEFKLDGGDFYYFGLNNDIRTGLGRSILGAIPFVSYIEQQLIDDMRKTMRNTGYHKLHVQIKPPERMSGESDDAYVNRVNSYFDDTVSMIKNCEPDDNPVTWDNVKIEYIGPSNARAVSNSWFLSHRAMIEEICAGTNLSPFMLGYSYGTTHNWAQFKYDLVMRQVTSVQRQAARFLVWIGNVELALKGLPCRCRYLFNNSLSYLAAEGAQIQKTRTDNLIELLKAGLISKETAQAKAGELI
jgi:hypothetical protein